MARHWPGIGQNISAGHNWSGTIIFVREVARHWSGEFAEFAEFELEIDWSGEILPKSEVARQIATSWK